MTTYTLKLKTLSDAAIGSAQSFGPIIDSDIVFDDHGLPYIPAKRIKGLFLNAAEDLLKSEAFKELSEISEDEVHTLFGREGQIKAQPQIIFENLHLKDYAEISPWLSYLKETYSYTISKQLIMEYFASTRTQTAIDPKTKTAKDGSLRSFRVLHRGHCFEGKLIVSTEDPKAELLLILASMYIKRIGSKRNRGFGKIAFKLYKDDSDLNQNWINKMEGTCTN